MTKTKWTPGPWERLPNATNIETTVANAGVVYGGGWSLALVFADGGIGKDRAAANAALIAAAPTLYALAEKVAEHFAGTDAPLGIEARAALASATGGTK